jgi:hypothetical protein
VNNDASGLFFRNGGVPRLKIQISDAELQKLQQQNREYVRCTVIENNRTPYEQVGIHLKGAGGSTRSLDDKPALTLNFDRFKKGQTFHDLDKIHLNNSVQDPSYLNEQLSSELFLAAGVPAPRVTHARVWLNGRDLGFYVLKEGFNKRFLKRYFVDASGNLYEPAELDDLNGSHKLVSGKGPENNGEVNRVVEACQEPDPRKRWQRVARLVDVDAFLTYMAMELMTGHWDGYTANRNNYRFYFDPATGKLRFFPQGMDQMFQHPDMSVLIVPQGSLVTRAVMSNPAWQTRYRQKVYALRKLFVPPDRLLKRVDALHRQLRPALAEMGAAAALDFDQNVLLLKTRLTAQASSLISQTSPAAKASLSRSAPIPPLKNWEPRMETPDARVTTISGPNGRGGAKMLSITAGPSGQCVASWRMRVMLPAGDYRFVALARASGIRAFPDPKGLGGGIRISGSNRTNHLTGTTRWTKLAFDFPVRSPLQEVVLVAELRAASGSVLFYTRSLRLVRIRR